MRLLKTEESDAGRFEIEEFRDDETPQYAILSHTWDEDEVTFQDMKGTDEVLHRKGYAKVKHCCFVARTSGFDYVWIDTCCIDKTSTAELSEAINSMYSWYIQAEVCYAYLADMPSYRADHPADGHSRLKQSKWFTRGWTLQELIAPSKVVFLDYEWKEFGTKSSLQQSISQITGIPVRILLEDDDLETASIAQRMSWAANRKTSRPEDQAYCLMGLFGINMPLLYGEGKMAFVRLQEEIMKVSDDHSIFAWTSKDRCHGGLLATSPDAFEESGNIILRHNPSISTNTPWTTTNKGIHLDLSFIGIGHRGLGLAILHCAKFGREDLFLGIYIRDISLTMERFERVRCENFELINLRRFRLSQYPVRRICVQQRRLTIARTARDHRKHDRKVATTKEHYLSPGEARLGLKWELFDPELTNFADITEPATRLPTPREGGKVQPLRRDTDTNLAYEAGRTPLSRAAGSGCVEEVRKLLALMHIQADLKDKDGRTPLSYAAAGGHAKIVWLLLAKHSVKADSKDADGRTPLSYAAGGGHREVVWLLLTRSDIEIHSRDSVGQTPLSHAAKNGHDAVINMLLTRKDFLDHLKDRDGRTPLSHAAAAGHEAAVKLFITRSDIEPNMVDNYNRTPLSWAAEKGREVVVQLLLDSGVDFELNDNYGRSPLAWAAEKGHEAVVQLLLYKGANFQSKDNDDRTPLSWAARNGHAVIVQLLLNVGADIESKDTKGRTPLSRATKNGHMAAVQLLLEKGADIKSRDNNNRTPLWVAAQKGREAVVQLLIKQGADYESKDNHGRTPLSWAAENGHEAVLKHLLESGANTESADNREGRTPLLFAAKNGHGAVVKHLLDAGANTESTDSREGRTPLSWAAASKTPLSWTPSGHGAVVKYLLEKEANTEATDNTGRTPLSYAAKNGHEAVVKHLLEKGANTELRDKYGQTPPSYAVLNEHEAVVQLLQPGL